MTPTIRAQVAAMISAGASNTAIRDALGVTVNQVAGVRCRDFGATMSRAAARSLPKRHAPSRHVIAFDALVLTVLRPHPPLPRRMIAAVLGLQPDSRLSCALRRLVRSGAAQVAGSSKATVYSRRSDA